MNHYPRHIGDWMRDTAHLSEVEECIYSRCIDQYYSREKPLPTDKASVCRLVRATTSAAKKAVASVLEEFFQLQDDGWHQKRCDQELGKFTERSTKAAESAAARWGKSQSERNANASPNAHANAMRTHSEGNASQKPVANSQEPEKGQKQRERPPTGSRLSLDTLPDDWRAYCQRERSDLLPDSVWQNFRDYWTAKPGKEGLKADWLATWRTWVRRESAGAPGQRMAAQPANRQTALEQRNLQVVSGWRPPE